MENSFTINTHVKSIIYGFSVAKIP